MPVWTNQGTVQCFSFGDVPVLTRARCNGARDCLNSDGEDTHFAGAYCNGLAYCALDPKRTWDILDKDTGRRLYRVSGRWATQEKARRCRQRLEFQQRQANFQTSPPDYTVNIPGVTDILRVPGLETKELRRQRWERMQTSRSALPEPLRWIPPLLNKLDDAQDLLFTGLAIAWPLFKLLGKPFLGPLGWLLTINDILNLGT